MTLADQSLPGPGQCIGPDGSASEVPASHFEIANQLGLESGARSIVGAPS